MVSLMPPPCLTAAVVATAPSPTPVSVAAAPPPELLEPPQAAMIALIDARERPRTVPR